MLDLELMQKRVEFIQTMKDSMEDFTADGSPVKFFSSKFLVQKYLKLSDADLKLNAKLKKEEIEDLNLAGGEDDQNNDKYNSRYESLADKITATVTERLSDNIAALLENKQRYSRRKKKPLKKDNEEE